MRTPAERRHDARLWLSRRTLRTFAPPDWLSVNVTLRCNLACAMCTTCYDAPELSAVEIRDLIDQAADWGVRVFNPLGGEPFIRQDLEEILAHASTRDMYTTLTSNGTLIHAGRAAKIAAIPPERLHINLSLDGPPEIHDGIRGAGMYARTLAGYRRLREADALAGNPLRRISVNSILHRQNLSVYEPFLDALEAEGFYGVQVLNLFRNGTEKTASDLWFTPEDLPELERVCARLAARGRFVLNRPEDLRLIPRYYREGLKPLEAPCWAGWKELYVNADGAVLVCDGKLDFLNGRFGDVRKATLRELWDSAELRERRKVVRACATPCVQNCYLRRESDSAAEIGRDLASEAARGLAEEIRRLGGRLGERLGGRLRQAPPAREIRTPLCLELSDIPADPAHPRFLRLFRGRLPEPDIFLHPEGYPLLRDQGRLDTGRGFLGREVLARALTEIGAAGLRLAEVRLGWRGDPLLHPEFLLLLPMLAEAQRDGRIGRLRLGCTGAFLSAEIAARIAEFQAAAQSGGAGMEVEIREARWLGRGAGCGGRAGAAWTDGLALSWDGKLTEIGDVRLERARDALREGLAGLLG